MVKTAWLGAVKKEIKTLVDAHTFVHDSMREGEKSIPVMELFKVKIKSDGSLDKLKCRMVVRGDLQTKLDTEDKWSPTASFRALKMFLAPAAKLRVRIKQLDFIGAYLQAKTRSRLFVMIYHRYLVFYFPNTQNIVEDQYDWPSPCMVPLSVGNTGIWNYRITYWKLDSQPAKTCNACLHNNTRITQECTY